MCSCRDQYLTLLVPTGLLVAAVVRAEARRPSWWRAATSRSASRSGRQVAAGHDCTPKVSLRASGFVPHTSDRLAG